ncbi:MAG: GGDEF domain-containing protein [Pseudomonadota bacterium]
MNNEQILGLLNPLIALVFAITFFVFWSKYKDRSYILGIAFAYLMHGTGFLISHLVADVDGLVHALGTNILFSLGTISVIWAACYRKQLDVSLGLLGLIAICATSALIYVQINPVGLNARLFITNTSYGFMFAIGAASLFRSTSGGAIEKVLFVTFALTALQFWIRPVITMDLAGSVDHTGYRDSVYYSVLNVTIALLSLMLAVSLIVACMSDIMSDIRNRTEKDMLTGLKIRRVFEDDAEKLFSQLEHTPLPVSMVLADIDHFKQVNDNYGHQIGDNAIAEFGKLLKDMSREGDVSGRVGGEEFCVLLWNSNLSGARIFAENIRAIFAQTEIRGMPNGYFLTASFGIAEVLPGESYCDLFKRADAALYEAKGSGRDRVKSAGPDFGNALVA